MSIRLRRPSNRDLRALLEAGKSDSLTYAPVGISSQAIPPDGYHCDRWSRRLGRGDDVFTKAIDALTHWRVHEGAGLIVFAEGPPVVGSVVAMAAPLPLGFIDVVCRVVSVVDEPDRYSFVYGTLSAHPEQGEESFTVVSGTDDEITFEIVAVSRARHVAARLGAPIARRMQRAATERYLDSMQAAIEP